MEIDIAVSGLKVMIMPNYNNINNNNKGFFKL